MIFRQAIQIGDNVTDILKLPCVKGGKKCDDKAGFEWLMYILKWGGCAEKGDWLCENTDGYWSAHSNEEYLNIIHNSHE